MLKNGNMRQKEKALNIQNNTVDTNVVKKSQEISVKNHAKTLISPSSGKDGDGGTLIISCSAIRDIFISIRAGAERRNGV